MRAFNQGKVPFHPLPSILAEAVTRSPLDLEIGAGQGLHAVQYCHNNPRRSLIATERTNTRFAQLKRRSLAHPELNNLFAVQADAVSAVTHWLQDDSLDRVFLLYPNPYPKTKQANLRWHNMPFMQILSAKMRSGAELILATNIESYMNEAQDKMQNTWRFRLLSCAVLGPDHVPRTHFEKKYLARQERCWNLVFQKP
jgi:tRNA G46 methylase TrmB